MARVGVRVKIHIVELWFNYNRLVNHGCLVFYV